MKMIAWNDCDCERCELGRAGWWTNNQWTCFFGTTYCLLEGESV